MSAALAKEVLGDSTSEEITDADRDSLHILPISILPVMHPMLRRARLVKNARLDSVVEFFSGMGTGSGQSEISAVAKLVAQQGEAHKDDFELLRRVGDLSSFDVYSLRILLRANNIAIVDQSALSLSPSKVRSLSAYMATFTRPLVKEIFGMDAANIQQFGDIIALFHTPNAGEVRERLAAMSQKLGIPVMGIPKFLEDYGDIFMSLSYYRQCLDHISPQIQVFMDSMRDLRGNYQMAQDKNLMVAIDKIEEVVNNRLAAITGRLENFERSTSDMWRDLTAERFRKIESLVSSYHTGIGGVLCALSVKMNAWSRLFPNPVAGGPVRRAAFIMSDMRQGIDRICSIEDDAPMLSVLAD